MADYSPPQYPSQTHRPIRYSSEAPPTNTPGPWAQPKIPYQSPSQQPTPTDGTYYNQPARPPGSSGRGQYEESGRGYSDTPTSRYDSTTGRPDEYRGGGASCYDDSENVSLVSHNKIYSGPVLPTGRGGAVGGAGLSRYKSTPDEQVYDNQYGGKKSPYDKQYYGTGHTPSHGGHTPSQTQFYGYTPPHKNQFSTELSQTHYGGQNIPPQTQRGGQNNLQYRENNPQTQYREQNIPPQTQRGGQNSQTQYGGQNNSQTQYGGQNNPQTQYGGQNNPQTQYGGQNNPQTQYGGQNNPQTQYGGQNNPQTQYGGPEPSQTQYGGQNNPQTQYGGQNNPQTQYGGPEPSQTQYRNYSGPIDGGRGEGPPGEFKYNQYSKPVQPQTTPPGDTASSLREEVEMQKVIKERLIKEIGHLDGQSKLIGQEVKVLTEEKEQLNIDVEHLKVCTCTSTYLLIVVYCCLLFVGGRK